MFGLSLVEVGANSVISDPSVMTLPKAISLFKAQGMMQEVYVLSCLIMLVAVVITYVSSFGLRMPHWLFMRKKSAFSYKLAKAERA